jgi:DNA-binding winged helix-turn-helix (wHTH) protein
MIGRMRRFGPFELDLATGELRKNGVRVRLQDQPLRILQALLETPGEMLTREQLRDRLWPSDTFVDFERSLNAAVAKLRQALGDSAEQPLYVETVARKGYRFVAPVTAAENSPAPAPRRFPISVVIGAASVAVAALTWIALRPSPRVDGEAVAFSVPMPPGTVIPPYSYAPLMSISPDGRTLVLAALQDGISTLWLRPIGSEISRMIPGTDGGTLPFWSPDGKQIAFFGGNKLKKVGLTGEPPSIVCEANEAFGGAWGRAGVIVFEENGGMWSVPAGGGAKKQVLARDEARGEIRLAWPSFLPDGRRFVYFSANRDPALHAIGAASLDDTRGRVLFRNASRAVAAPPDDLLFPRDGVLYAQRWNVNSGRSLGDPRPVVPNVNSFVVGQAAFSVSDNGVLAYRTGASSSTRLAAYSREGKRLRDIGPPGPYVQMALAPDEKTVALQIARSPLDRPARLALLRLDSEVLSNHEFGKFTNGDPVWSPDSKRIAFAAFEGQAGGPTDLMVWTVGEISARRLFTDGRSNKPDAWSPDGRFVLCRRDDGAAFALPAEEGAKPEDVGDTPAPKDGMKLSPDGKLVAFNSSNGRPEVFVARFPGMSGRVQVSAAGGMQPIWTRDGRELIFAAVDNRLMSVEIQAGATIEAAAPKPLFRPANVFMYWASQYGVSSDGQRVYVIEPAAANADGWHVLTRWHESTRP